MKFHLSLITALVAFMFIPTTHAAYNTVVGYNGLTGTVGNTVYDRVVDGRIVPQVTAQYTDNLGVLALSSRERSLYILRNNFRFAFECASGLDVTKCHAVDPKLQTASK